MWVGQSVKVTCNLRILFSSHMKTGPCSGLILRFWRGLQDISGSKLSYDFCCLTGCVPEIGTKKVALGTKAKLEPQNEDPKRLGFYQWLASMLILCGGTPAPVFVDGKHPIVVPWFTVFKQVPNSYPGAGFCSHSINIYQPTFSGFQGAKHDNIW